MSSDVRRVRFCAPRFGIPVYRRCTELPKTERGLTGRQRHPYRMSARNRRQMHSYQPSQEYRGMVVTRLSSGWAVVKRCGRVVRMRLASPEVARAVIDELNRAKG